MHYYKKNIGDYHKKAGRLSMLEHGAYTLLLDACYDRERFPTLEDAIDWTWARTEEEMAAVRFVLSKFFTKEGDIYVQERIKEEVAKYKANADTNARIAQEREQKRRDRAGYSTNRAPSVNEQPPQDHEAPPNQEPITINQEPRTTHTEAHASGVARDELPEPHELPVQTTSTSHLLSGVVCKAIKQTGIGLVNPGHPKLNALLHAGVTVEQVVAACAKALEKQKNFSYALGILEKEEKEARELSVQLYKPKASARNQPAPKSFAQQEREAGWLRWEEMTGRKHPEMEKIRAAESGITGDVIDITPRGDDLLLEG